MKVLLTGARGQLGTLLQRGAPAHVTLLATDSTQLDIRAADKLAETCRSFQPDVVINAAAYTQVDKAESEPELAMAINHQGMLNLIAATASANLEHAGTPTSSVADTFSAGARSPVGSPEYAGTPISSEQAGTPTSSGAQARSAGAPVQLIHISTDFVFDGTATRPYRVDDPVNPLGVYGRSKLAGEQALQQLAPERSCIIRTAWLYADEGKNFLNTMLHLMGTRPELKVVHDQRGTPTSAHGLADAVWRLVAQHGTPTSNHGTSTPGQHGTPTSNPYGTPTSVPAAQPPHGLYHWTDAGEATWYEFACEIQRLALQHGLLERAIPILPITTADYPTPARRPAYSVLDKQSTWAALGVQGTAWQTELNKVLALKRARQQNATRA